jgi:hypothetical protein
LNNARCGDTIHLQAGATFTGSSYRPRTATTTIGSSSEPVLRTALCPPRVSGPRPAMPGSLRSRGARRIAAPIPRT